MEVKAWTYDEFPDYTAPVLGAIRLKTTGDEIGVFHIPNVEYAHLDGIKLCLQILVPFTRNEPERVYPCIVFAQGSAWMKQNVFVQCPMLSRLAVKGYVIAVVQYRHSEIAVFPAQIQDAKNAIRYMRIHAREYHVNSESIIAAGDSSGGHTAMFCGIVEDDSEMDKNIFPGIPATVKGIVNYYGAVSLIYEDGFPSTVNYGLPDSPEGMLMGKVNLREHPELQERGSVECYIRPELTIVPTLILHGTKDRTVNVSLSVNLFQKMKECGKDVNLYLVDGADHGGAEFWTDEVCCLVDTFAKKCIQKIERKGEEK
ncbi:MAG: alpha/beta hydrolase [Treponema sp.]|nr:alpha/beta hydrolase [Treponema sp.]